MAIHFLSGQISVFCSLDEPLGSKIATPLIDEWLGVRDTIWVKIVDVRLLGVSDREPRSIIFDLEDDFRVTHQIAALRVIVGNTHAIVAHFFDG